MPSVIIYTRCRFDEVGVGLDISAAYDSLLRREEKLRSESIFFVVSTYPFTYDNGMDCIRCKQRPTICGSHEFIEYLFKHTSNFRNAMEEALLMLIQLTNYLARCMEC